MTDSNPNSTAQWLNPYEILLRVETPKIMERVKFNLLLYNDEHFLVGSIRLILFLIVKDQNFPRPVPSKCGTDDGRTKIFRDLNAAVALRFIELRCKSIRTNIGKEDTMKISFSDKKMFDIDAPYNSQSGWIRAINRSQPDGKGGIEQKRTLPQHSEKNIAAWMEISIGAMFRPLTLATCDAITRQLSFPLKKPQFFCARVAASLYNILEQ